MNIVTSFREVPTEDDPGAKEYTQSRTVSHTNYVVPCRWGLLDNAKTRQDAQELVCSTLVGLQTLAYTHFGGKFPYLYDEHGFPRTEWDMNFSDGTVEEKLSVVVPICKLAMYFVRTFGQLVAKFGRSPAVNLVDGIVTAKSGLASIVGMLLQHLVEGNVTAGDLELRTLDARRTILGEHEFVLENDVILQNSPDTLTNESRLCDVILHKRPPTMLSSRPLKMLRLAQQGYIWRTDPEASSILKAVCRTSPITVGRWEPLTRMQRDELFDAMDANGNFHVVGTGTWVRRIWGRNTLVRRESFYERVERSCLPSLGFSCMPTCEQDGITDRTVELLSWMRDKPEEWAVDLFNDLYHLKKAGYPSKSEEVSKAIELARSKASTRHGNDDDCFDMLFGPINTGYSFACECAQVSQFARLHYLRCLRIIGICTTVDGVPLHALESSQTLSGPVKSIVQDVTTLEPILNDLQERETPELSGPWNTEMW